jgi:hypothetical protein
LDGCVVAVERATKKLMNYSEVDVTPANESEQAVSTNEYAAPSCGSGVWVKAEPSLREDARVVGLATIEIVLEARGIREDVGIDPVWDGHMLAG